MKKMFVSVVSMQVGTGVVCGVAVKIAVHQFCGWKLLKLLCMFFSEMDRCFFQCSKDLWLGVGLCVHVSHLFLTLLT